MSTNQSLFVERFSIKNFAATHEIKPVLTLNRPIYVGFTVLELSKWLLYDFHHNFIKNHFAVILLFTDMDILTYEITSKDVYEEFLNTNTCLNLVNFNQIFLI